MSFIRACRSSVTNLRMSRSLRRNLVVTIGLVAVVSAVTSGLILWYGGRVAIRVEALRRMDAIADSRAEILGSLVRDWVRDIRDLVRDRSLREDMILLAARRGSPTRDLAEIRRDNSERLVILCGPQGVGQGAAVFVCLRTGEPLAWCGLPDRRAAESAAREYALDFLATRKVPWMSAVHPREPTGSPEVDVIAVVHSPGPDQAPVAALVWHIRVTETVWKHTGDFGETGEIVLVDDSGMALKPLRHDPTAMLRRRLDTEPARRALSGRAATFAAQDYAGHAVLAACRKLPITGWGLVAKMDVSEAYESVSRWTLSAALVTVLVLAVGLVIAYNVAANLARPIVDLAATADQVAQGDLSAKFACDRPDELGRLGVAFAVMVERLADTQHGLEELVRARTADLQESNEQLRREIAEREQITEELVRSERELRALHLQLMLTEENERRHLADELHDTVVQLLAFAKMKLQQARAGAPEQYPGFLDDAFSGVQQAIDASRQIMTEISPALLYQLDLGAALAQLGERFASQHGLRLSFSDDEQPKPLSQDVSVVLFNCSRELLNNVAKHAQAANVALRVERDGDDILVHVQDDGIGFQASREAEQEGGYGLASVRERMRQAGGSVTVTSGRGGGTQATLRAPLDLSDSS